MEENDIISTLKSHLEKKENELNELKDELHLTKLIDSYTPNSFLVQKIENDINNLNESYKEDKGFYDWLIESKEY